MGTTAYSEEYYEHTCQGARASAEEVVPLVLRLVPARRVVDVGCGLGSWLAVFREHGVEDVLGIDGDYVPRDRLEIPAERFAPFDLSRPLKLRERFDLVVSLEVAEHLPQASAAVFVDSLTGLGPAVLFSAAVPSQGGTHHVNEQWPEYWAGLFAERGHVAFDCLRPEIWGNPRVEWWYAQNALLFVHREHPLAERLRASSPGDAAALPRRLVHPRSLTAEAERTAADIAAAVPEGSTLLLAGGDQLGRDISGGHLSLPFVERDGLYAGPPEDDAHAIRELERLRDSGADVVVFVWSVLWWLDHYAGFASHLRSRYARLVENDRVTAFDLRS